MNVCVAVRRQLARGRVSFYHVGLRDGTQVSGMEANPFLGLLRQSSQSPVSRTDKKDEGGKVLAGKMEIL